jgi:hypoxanthine phosphoribosyltransferase
MQITREEAWRILDRAELVCGPDAVAAAVERVAGDIARRLSDAQPLVLAVMGGGIVFCGQLLTHLRFPLDLDYIHATRYRGGTTGGTIDWRVRPREDVRGRVVLVVDDILDEGHTLAAIRESLLEAGAAEVLNVVFCEKQLPGETHPGGFRGHHGSGPLRVRLRHGCSRRLAQPSGDLRPHSGELTCKVRYSASSAAPGSPSSPISKSRAGRWSARPFGEPSGALTFGSIRGQEVVFLAGTGTATRSHPTWSTTARTSGRCTPKA